MTWQPQQPGRLLVVGADGLVGRHVAAAAVEAGLDVTAVARTLPDGRVFDLAADLCGLVELAQRCDVVVWAAARPSVEGCELDPEGTRRINVDVVKAVVDTLPSRTGFIAFSSEYVFDGAKGASDSEGCDYVEGDLRHALNVYGRQKIELEDLVLAHPRGAVLRISGVFGVEPARKNFVWQLVDASHAGRRVAVANDQWITPTFAPDLGAVVVDVAARILDGTFAGLLHAAGPAVVRRDLFARQVVEVLGLRDDVVDAKATDQLGLRARRPSRVGLDTSFLHQLTGTVIRSPPEALCLLKDAP